MWVSLKKITFLLRFIDISFPFEMNFKPISEIRVVKACICMCKISLLELFSPVVQIWFWIWFWLWFILSWCNICILFTFSSSFIGHLYWINFNNLQLKSSHISLRNKVGGCLFYFDLFLIIYSFNYIETMIFFEFFLYPGTHFVFQLEF